MDEGLNDYYSFHGGSRQQGFTHFVFNIKMLEDCFKEFTSLGTAGRQETVFFLNENTLSVLKTLDSGAPPAKKVDPISQ